MRRYGIQLGSCIHYGRHSEKWTKKHFWTNRSISFDRGSMTKLFLVQDKYLPWTFDYIHKHLSVLSYLGARAILRIYVVFFSIHKRLHSVFRHKGRHMEFSITYECSLLCLKTLSVCPFSKKSSAVFYAWKAI